MIPKDPAMLLSFVNLKLRDNYKSLAEMCDDLEINLDEIVETLKKIDYEYDEKVNQFV